jgi:leucyl-tRNA synthetase
LESQYESWSGYNPKAIEPTWQDEWERQGLYIARQSDLAPKFYCLDFFPYPSGEGLHVGHCRNYIPTDVVSRHKRMQGFNVLHPMGWDAFGEPAEQYAITQNVHPRVTTDRNTANFRRQMRMIGTSYDWSREIDSSRPEFYHWTQAIFLILYQRGLAYRDMNWQWWCPTCQTTLSSHEVSGGVCWRGHLGVTRREIPAWYFRITAYADQLLDGLLEIDWPENVKAMQRNWIGRSEGCDIIFNTHAGPLPVFTTRPDTLFGATFLVLAPEHAFVDELTTAQARQQVSAYKAQAAERSEVERLMENRPKTGVFTGSYAIHPLSSEQIPVWIADYVQPGYGTGAVMGVPAHDQRDFDFAVQYGLEIRVVVAPSPDADIQLTAAYDGQGIIVGSGPYSGMPSEQAAVQISKDLKQRKLGGPSVRYRMRDWLISRQRYWGTPIPIVYCERHGEQPLREDQLPVLLPPMTDFQPDGSGRSPLGRMPEFVTTTCPLCGEPARRETDTMGGFACSSWYFLRFSSPDYDMGPYDPEMVRYWLPVDLYVGGAEHAVLHLLYARFWTRVLYDTGLLPFSEPFTKLLNQGQMLGPDGFRMSKSRGNVITPDSMVESFGADSLRVYELFMAPFEQDISWSTQGIKGARRFLNRIWILFSETYENSSQDNAVDPLVLRKLHQTIRQVSQRIDAFRFNTAVSALMEFVNLLADRQSRGLWHTSTYHQALDALMILLAPIAPHIAEELWKRSGHSDSIHQQPWPAWDEELAKDDIIQVAVQVDGKLRDVLEVSAESTEDSLRRLALDLPKIQHHLAGHEIGKIFYVPGRIINITTTTSISHKED